MLNDLDYLKKSLSNPSNLASSNHKVLGFHEFFSLLNRPVNGSVRFGLNHKNQPNHITHIFRISNRTEPNSGSNRIGSVRLNLVFELKN